MRKIDNFLKDLLRKMYFNIYPKGNVFGSIKYDFSKSQFVKILFR